MAPILCAHLIRRTDQQLIELLGSLRLEEWSLPTVAGQWAVRDVAAHLLDTALRKLALARDGWFVEKVELRTPGDVAVLVNRLNREGVTVYRRLSPRVLIELMTLVCEQCADHYESLDPFADAAIAVSWAGDETSPNWFDTARDLTERWHHQQQIREATGRPGIMTPELYHPVLDCFARALPHTYRAVAAAPGTTVRMEIAGECGGAWQIRREAARWLMETPSADRCDARVTIPETIAWRVFTKGISREAVLAQIQIEGDHQLGLPVIGMTAIVASD